MREKKRGFHPVRWIKELVKKIGTLNLILILVGAFLSGSTGRCYVSSEIMRRFLKLMLARSLRLQSANAEYAAG